MKLMKCENSKRSSRHFWKIATCGTCQKVSTKAVRFGILHSRQPAYLQLRWRRPRKQHLRKILGGSTQQYHRRLLRRQPRSGIGLAAVSPGRDATVARKIVGVMLHLYATQVESWLENPETVAEAAAQIEQKLFPITPGAAKTVSVAEDVAQREAEAKKDSQGMAKVFSKAFAAAMGQPPPPRSPAIVSDSGGSGGAATAARLLSGKSHQPGQQASIRMLHRSP